MKAILVDDERQALTLLENQLVKFAGVHVIGKFTAPKKAMEKILLEDVDVVFLDIHMPEINGIELAEKILAQKPGVNIVFVTAYDNYAVEAFELHALDYILKPVSKERLLKTVERIKKRKKETESSNFQADQQMLHIQLFRQVAIGFKGQHLTVMRWRTTRAEELFLYLLQHRGQLIRKSVLLDLLWPELEQDRAYPQLYTAVYHIRKTLESFGSHFQISNIMDGYILKSQNVLIDVEEWENFISAELPLSADTIDDYEKTMDLYTGDYLQGYDYWWAESERHRLMLLWLRTSFRMAEWYMSCHRTEKAIEKYLEICERYPQAEEAHFALMAIYASMEIHLLVHRQYRLLTAVLREELNEQPSRHITEWYQNWCRTNKFEMKS
ncbi:response regulator [Paenibacillus sp. PDC88]|uniref:response regulator n=1 Tax=Paenibacillus TaxID=44249 RepID=UPI000898C183|nr:response regulator [Paenibacillus sp. PDC88]SDX83254.1 Two-component response regulator, SAPR family, consists of REC, wHTH and BTAD domains [Paenibacillus sp. PDC88]